MKREEELEVLIEYLEETVAQYYRAVGKLIKGDENLHEKADLIEGHMSCIKKILNSLSIYEDEYKELNK